MSSPKATGGAGTHYESRVAAYYLAATLARSAVRGLPDGVAQQVQLQRAFAGQPLDDVIVRVALPTGDVGTLSLQAKRQFLVSTQNEIFAEVLQSCWKTFSSLDFRWRRDRFGVAFSVYSSKADNHYQSVLSWARQSADSADFFARLTNRGTSHESARSFVGSIREALRQAAGTDLDNHTLWRFLSSLVLLHFDFEAGDASRDHAHALDLCTRSLMPEPADRPAELWCALLEEADVTAATAGSLDRAALIAKLESRFHFGIGKTCLRDVHRLSVEARHAMADIDEDIGGVHFDRLAILDEVDAALSHADCVEIVGEPGVGKSAILKAVAERQLSQGPILFLKHDRLALEAGWVGQARLWNLENDLATLLIELGTASRPCIFIDGIDRISDPSAWTIVNDLLREALRRDRAPRFQLVVTARSTALDYRIRLDSKMLSALRIHRVGVSTLQEAEVTTIRGCP